MGKCEVLLVKTVLGLVERGVKQRARASGFDRGRPGSQRTKAVVSEGSGPGPAGAWSRLVVSRGGGLGSRGRLGGGSWWGRVLHNGMTLCQYSRED